MCQPEPTFVNSLIWECSQALIELLAIIVSITLAINELRKNLTTKPAIDVSPPAGQGMLEVVSPVPERKRKKMAPKKRTYPTNQRKSSSQPKRKFETYIDSD